jgi:hypothetical protein
MSPRDIIQARIDELQSDLDFLVATMKETPAPENKDEQFKLVATFKDRALTLRSAIAELKNVKELM